MKNLISALLLLLSFGSNTSFSQIQPRNAQITAKLNQSIEKNGGSNNYWYKNSNWVPQPSTTWTTFKSNLLKTNPTINESLAEKGKFCGVLIINLDKKGMVKYTDFLYSSRNDSILINTVLTHIYQTKFQSSDKSLAKQSFEPFKAYFEIKADKSLLTTIPASSIPDSVNNPWRSLDSATLAAINKFEFPTTKEKVTDSSDQTAINNNKYPNNSNNIKVSEDTNFVKAQFFGGDRKFQELIMDNFVYPSRCLEKGISGHVQLKFRVNREGIVDKITTTTKTPSCPEFTAEAKRVIQLAPWIPATYKGKVINCWLTIPIKLSVQ